MARRWIRLGGGAGVVAVVVALASFPLNGSSPDSSASPVKIGDYVLHHQHQLTATGLLAVLSAALLTWFFASYAWLLHRNDPETPLGFVAAVSGAGLVAVLVADGMLDVAMSFLSHQSAAVHSSAMTELYQVENGVVVPGAFGLVAAAFLVAVAAAAFRGVAGVRWVGYLASVLAPLAAAGGVVGLTTLGGGMSSPLSFAPAFGISLTALVLGVGMLRDQFADVVLGDGRRQEATVAG
jgi:hypothetical protein